MVKKVKETRKWKKKKKKTFVHDILSSSGSQSYEKKKGSFTRLMKVAHCVAHTRSNWCSYQTQGKLENSYFY